MNRPLLTIITFLPALGALAIALLPREKAHSARYIAAAFTLVDLALVLALFGRFNLSEPGVQFVDRVQWIRIGGFNVDYFLGVDGLSLPMVILTGIIGFLAVLVSWKISLRPKEYFALLLILQSGVMGVFTALDFFLFFLFWEVELVPMYLLIGIWGSARREYAAIKFLVYTMVGSAGMLVGILWLYFHAGLGTFDILQLGAQTYATGFQAAIFFVLMLGFAIKLPVFPLHTWLPDAHTEAPTAISVILAGVLLKMGGYGMIRTVVTILPDAARQYAGLLAAIAIISILYGAAVSMVQKDLKRLIAYSSVSHMGYVLLGISALTAVSFSGAILQMFTHGIITGLLFTMVGLVYEKAHTRQIADMGGFARHMPLIATCFVFAGLASLGLPGLAGFVAEFLVFVGSYPSWQIVTIMAIVAIVLTAGYILWALQRAFFGPPNPRYDHLGDADAIDVAPVFVFMGLIALVGVYPSVIVNVINLAVTNLMQRFGA